MLLEKNIATMPVLQINDICYEFNQAMNYIRGVDEVIESEEKKKEESKKVFIDLKIVKNENVDKIEEALKNNNGYCPCKLQKSDDTKCICKEFRESTEVGNCHCGLYHKEIFYCKEELLNDDIFVKI